MRTINPLWLVVFFFFFLGIFVYVVGGCNGPKDYLFRYVVDVKYKDDRAETLSGEIKLICNDPDNVVFTLSERFRKEPCLVLSQSTDEIVIGGTLNIACGVRSFKTQTLEWREVKDGK